MAVDPFGLYMIQVSSCVLWSKVSGFNNRTYSC
uniref:Uncharacterized protein n=1 Tax=Arundo donax TaxID=35708 RepID=A0A0A9BFI0_ARUDO